MEPNILNQYWHPAYHFTLFMAGDKDLIDNTGGTNISEILSTVNGGGINRVIIAETGVTGYNIKEVNIDSVNSQNAMTREQKATSVTMVITEPMGISFLDAISGAGTLLEIWDYTKSVYYLQLSFTGYKEDGSFAGNPLPNGSKNQGSNNGGRWLWALKLTNIETKINEGGGVYSLTFVTTESEPVMMEEKALKVKQIDKPEGKNLKQLFDDYAKKLTKAWETEYGKNDHDRTLITFKIDASEVIKFGSNAGKKPEDFLLQPIQPQISSLRALNMGSPTKDGVYTVTVPAGMSINQFITSAIVSTEEGQKLVLDEAIPNDTDKSLSEVNPKRFRASTLFSIEYDIHVDNFEPKTGNYYKTLTVHIIPTYSQAAIMSRIQVTNSRDPQVQRDMVDDLGKNGFLRKEYDYIFTGMNTEVLDFNISFNLSWQAELPKLAGRRMSFLNVATEGRYNPPGDKTAQDAAKAKLETQPLKSATTSTEVLHAGSLFEGGERDKATIPIPSLFEGMGENPNPTANTAAVKQTPVRSTGGKTYYIEDVLSRLNQGQKLPISFYDGYHDTARESGVGSNAQTHKGRSLAGAVLGQISGNTMTDAFQTIELNIRGDPFWLGQSNLERQIILRNKSGYDKTGLPDGSSGNQCIFLYFRYPLQIGDDFKPQMRDSEVFNGLYEITMVKHKFADGAFKQTLQGVRMPLIDIDLAYTMDPKSINTDENKGNANVIAGTANEGGGVTPGTGTGNPGDPRGIRNNNPTNLSYVSGQTNVQGSDGRFGVYPTMEDGVTAATNQLVINQQTHGLTTVAGQINRWSPAGENGKAKTDAYINYVSQQVGVGPNETIDVTNPVIAQKMITAMTVKENGRPIDAAIIQRGVAKRLG